MASALACSIARRSSRRTRDVSRRKAIRAAARPSGCSFRCNQREWVFELQLFKMKLLIVDDDEDIRSQLKWALAQDHEVVLAEDRASAVQVFRAESPMVV